MIDIVTVFWMFVAIFAFMGFVRGWSREALVTASIVLAYFIIYVMETYIPFLKNYFATAAVPDSQVIPIEQFWFRIVVLALLVFFGYETPSLPRIGGSRFKRDNFRDSALGLILAGFNGYLILGSLWGFLGLANYPFEIIEKNFSETALSLYARLPPFWMLESPLIFVAVIIAFLFIIVVFI